MSQNRSLLLLFESASGPVRRISSLTFGILEVSAALTFSISSAVAPRRISKPEGFSAAGSAISSSR